MNCNRMLVGSIINAEDRKKNISIFAPSPLRGFISLCLHTPCSYKKCESSILALLSTVYPGGDMSFKIRKEYREIISF